VVGEDRFCSRYPMRICRLLETLCIHDITVIVIRCVMEEIMVYVWIQEAAVSYAARFVL
jgi:hypothetical protein